MEVAVELIDFSYCLFGSVDQAHQFQVIGQNVLVGLKLIANKVQCALPECSAGDVQ